MFCDLTYINNESDFQPDIWQYRQKAVSLHKVLMVF